jgi:3-oxoacyl-[acyl-carrier-protein] synthase II
MLLGRGELGPIPGRRVAITGVGAVSSCGVGAGALWDGLIRATASGERRVPDFDPARWFGPKEVRRLDRFTHFAVAAAQEALDDAGEVGTEPELAGVIFASGAGGFETLIEQVRTFDAQGPRRVSPFLIPAMMGNAGAASISMRFGWQGPSESITTACASGSHAIGAAARLVASGRCDVAIGGGAEASIHEVALAAFTNMKALSSSGECRPFDRRRDGFVIGEGAGALVLEEWDRAVNRGARIYAELKGAASTSDAYHITAPQPQGDGATLCMTLALADAEVEAREVRHVNAHGTATPLNDLVEARAVNRVFGLLGPPVTANKGVTGHSFAAAGAIQAVAAALTIRAGVIPPTAGYEEPDPEIRLDVVSGKPRDWQAGPILCNSFGFGGHNGCLVLVPPLA